MRAHSNRPQRFEPPWGHPKIRLLQRISVYEVIDAANLACGLYNYVELFNGKMRDELLDQEIILTLQAAKVLIARWREEYNPFRPHSALDYRPPAPQAWLLAAHLAEAPGLHNN